MEQRIGVVGYECEDITIYLAGISCALGKKAAIIDRTEQEMICEMLGLRSEDNNTVKERDYCGIWITNRGVCADEFDIVFYVFGYRLEHPKLYDCEILLMITDGVPAHAALLGRIHNTECRRLLLLRNVVAWRHTVSYLTELAGKNVPCIELPYSERDIRERCSISGYGKIRIRNLSSGMKNALQELMDALSCGYSTKEIRNVLKKI